MGCIHGEWIEPIFLNKLVEFPGGTAWRLFELLDENCYYYNEDEYPEAAAFFTCRQHSGPQKDREAIMRVRMQYVWYRWVPLSRQRPLTQVGTQDSTVSNAESGPEVPRKGSVEDVFNVHRCRNHSTKTAYRRKVPLHTSIPRYAAKTTKFEDVGAWWLARLHPDGEGPWSRTVEPLVPRRWSCCHDPRATRQCPGGVQEGFVVSVSIIWAFAFVADDHHYSAIFEHRFSPCDPILDNILWDESSQKWYTVFLELS